MSDPESADINQRAIIASKIIMIRNEYVILDFHLAGMYGVQTRVLKQAVKRNLERFPYDFMYELTESEVDFVVSQNVIPSRGHLGGAVPFAFNENGVAMLSGILNSKKAIEINISIIRTFTLLRKMVLMNKDLSKEIERIKTELINQGGKNGSTDHLAPE